VGSYGVNGLSGTSQPLVTNTGTAFTPTVFPSPVAGAHCVPVKGGFNCDFSGPASDAYSRLVSNDFSSYAVGVQVAVPLSNANAQSQYTASRIATSEAELNHRQLLSNVTLEVRQAIANLSSSRQRIDTTRVARELAAENLRNQQKRYEVGMATTKDLLDFQSRLTQARGAEVQAKIDYANSVAAWRRAEGRLLAHYQIVVEHPGRRSTPWFARF
jgi:outer membrane protein TolC